MHWWFLNEKRRLKPGFEEDCQDTAGWLAFVNTQISGGPLCLRFKSWSPTFESLWIKNICHLLGSSSVASSDMLISLSLSLSLSLSYSALTNQVRGPRLFPRNPGWIGFGQQNASDWHQVSLRWSAQINCSRGSRGLAVRRLDFQQQLLHLLL